MNIQKRPSNNFMMMQNHQDMKSNNKFIKIEKFFKKLPKQINIELQKYRKFYVTNKKKYF